MIIHIIYIAIMSFLISAAIIIWRTRFEEGKDEGWLNGWTDALPDNDDEIEVLNRTQLIASLENELPLSDLSIFSTITLQMMYDDILGDLYDAIA